MMPELPYMLFDETPPETVTVTALECPYLGNEEQCTCWAAHSLEALLPEIQRFTSHPARCVMLEPLAPSDLTPQLAAILTRQLQCTVAVRSPTGRFPCGDSPRCMTRTAASATDVSALTKGLFAPSSYCSEQLVQFLPTFSQRNRQIILHWATTPSTRSAQRRAITLEELADIYNMSFGNIRKIIEKAKQENPKLLQRLEYLRKHHASVTRLRSNDAANGIDGRQQ